MLESKYLKDDVQNIQKLMAIPGLRKFETRQLAKLLRLSKIRQYEPDECIIREGDRDSWLYFLLTGKARVEKGGVVVGHIEKMGDMFGEMRLIDSLSRSASVFAHTQIVCLAVDTAAAGRRGFEDERTDFLLILYRMFAEFVSTRLRLTNEELSRTRRELEKLASQDE